MTIHGLLCGENSKNANMEEHKTVGEELPNEITRCKEILKNLEGIGPAGLFASTMLKRD